MVALSALPVFSAVLLRQQLDELLGFDSSFQPRFVKRYAELEQPMVDAVRSYCDEVRDGSFPTPAHAFHRRRGPKKVAKLY